MASIINNRSSLVTDPIRNFRFLVSFLEHTNANNSVGEATSLTSTMGFTSVSGLSVTTDSIPYREGGYNTTVHQIPGQTTFAPITLQRGLMVGSAENWNRMRQLFATVNGGAAAGITNNFRFDLEIKVLSHPIPGAGQLDNGGSNNNEHVAARFRVYNCWVTSLAYSDLAAGDNAIFVEQMSIVHEGFDAHIATDLDTTAVVF